MPAWPSLRPSIVLAATLAAACQGGDPAGRVVAQVGDREINVAQVADYMANNRYGLQREAVQRAVDEMVNLLLVTDRAYDRYTTTKADSFQMEEWKTVLTINQYREDVLWKTVEVDEERLREWYDQNVSEQVRARHILLSVEPTASAAEKQTLRQRADSLLAEAREGADFAELARAHSDDPSSGPNGGLLRWFSRGEMVPPFEEAAFEGSTGQVYPEVVETQFGFHVLKVEEKRRPPFEELRESIEEQLMNPQRFEAEQAYVTRLMENSGVEFYESNIDTLIVLLNADPPRPVTGEHRALELADFRGGSITLGEIWTLYENLPAANQRAIQVLDQTQMVQALAGIVQQRLLLAEARTNNVELDSTRQRQLDERIDRLHVEGYMNEVARSHLEVPDSVVARYYDEHREFYGGQSLDEVRETIRDVLVRQRFEALQEPAAERRLVAAVADSQRGEVRVEIHEDRFDDVLAALAELYEEAGTDPATLDAGTGQAAPAPAPAPPPAGQSAPPAGQTAPPAGASDPARPEGE